MENSHKNLQLKKLYETILNNQVQIQVKKSAVLSLIKQALTDHSNFSFLLNQINWFCESNLQLIPLLAKVLRAYRGTSKTASKVVYNLLAEGLSIPKVNMHIVDLLVNIVQTYKDSPAVLECLRENYPHKICSVQSHIAYVESLLELSQKTPSERFQLLEIIIQNILTFDTQMILGEQFIGKPQYQDQDVLALSQKCGPFQNKYDQIMQSILNFLSKFDKKGKEVLLKEFYLIFQKTVMTIQNTQMIQYLIFYLAQTSPQHSQCFLTLLMVTIFQNYNSKQSKKIYISALQFLRSYLNRSVMMPEKKIKKVFLSLLSQFKQKLDHIEKSDFQVINLKQFGQEHIFDSYMLETILLINTKYPNVTFNKNIQSNYKSILDQASQKLYYTYFIDEQVLSFASSQNIEIQKKCSLNKDRQCLPTKFSEKFLPIFLPKTRKLIDIKLNSSAKRVRPNWSISQSTDFQFGSVPCKKHNSCLSSQGGQTPLTLEQYVI